MKYLVIIVLIGITAFIALESGILFEKGILIPEPAKAYIKYREKIMAAKGYTAKTNPSYRSSFAQWPIEVTDCQIEDSEATITATEFTSRIPGNVSSHEFATKVTREFRAILINEDGTWELIDERVLKQDTSTYEDRQNNR